MLSKVSKAILFVTIYNQGGTRCLIKVFHMNIDEIDRDIILDILETYCNPELVKEIVDN